MRSESSSRRLSYQQKPSFSPANIEKESSKKLLSAYTSALSSPQGRHRRSEHHKRHSNTCKDDLHALYRHIDRLHLKELDVKTPVASPRYRYERPRAPAPVLSTEHVESTAFDLGPSTIPPPAAYADNHPEQCRDGLENERPRWELTRESLLRDGFLRRPVAVKRGAPDGCEKEGSLLRDRGAFDGLFMSDSNLADSANHSKLSTLSLPQTELRKSKRSAFRHVQHNIPEDEFW